MRKVIFLIVICVVFSGFLYAQHPEKTKGGHVVPLLPESLTALYPPEAEGPVFLYKMLEMGGAFNSVMINLMQNDLENLKGDMKRFKALYKEIPVMVPEWKDRFPEGKVNELEKALTAGDKDKINKAFMSVGGVCHDCHVENMPLVQHRFAWKNFSDVNVTDPVTKEKKKFHEFMRIMTFSFDAIMTDLRDGQPEISKKHFDDFNVRFTALSGSCYNCHDSERSYYVDEKVFTMVNSLGEEIARKTPDIKKVQQLSGAVGFESCYKCHLVHTGAAFTQAKMRQTALIK